MNLKFQVPSTAQKQFHLATMNLSLLQLVLDRSKEISDYLTEQSASRYQASAFTESDTGEFEFDPIYFL